MQLEARDAWFFCVFDWVFDPVGGCSCAGRKSKLMNLWSNQRLIQNREMDMKSEAYRSRGVDYYVDNFRGDRWRNPISIPKWLHPINLDEIILRLSLFLWMLMKLVDIIMFRRSIISRIPTQMKLPLQKSPDGLDCWGMVVFMIIWRRTILLYRLYCQVRRGMGGKPVRGDEVRHPDSDREVTVRV